MCSDYPVARYDDTDRIMTDRTANCLCGHPVESAFLCDLISNPPICDCFPKRNPAHDFSNPITKI